METDEEKSDDFTNYHRSIIYPCNRKQSLRSIGDAEVQKNVFRKE